MNDLCGRPSVGSLLTNAYEGRPQRAAPTKHATTRKDRKGRFNNDCHCIICTALGLNFLPVLLSTSALGVFAGLTGYACWRPSVLPSLGTFIPGETPVEITSPDVTIAAAVLIAYALALALTVNRYGFHRSCPWILVSAVAVWGAGFPPHIAASVE